MELNHLSYSSISTWLMCPRSWRFRYLDKVPVPTAPALIFGSAFHNTVEEYLIRKHQVGAGEPQPLAELWPTLWQEQLAENEGNVNWGKNTPESCFNDGLRMLQAKEVCDVVDGLIFGDGVPQVEHRVELQVPDVPIPIIGYIDMIDRDGIPHDLKTSACSWNGDKAQGEIQPLFYLAALLQAGDVRHGFRFRHVVFVKTKTPQAQVIESQHSIGAVFWLIGLIREVWRAIEAGHFPGNPTSWKCSPDYCEYWGMCRGKT